MPLSTSDSAALPTDLTAGLTGTAFPTSFSIPGLDPTLSKLLSIESSIYENPTAISYLSQIETAAGAAITNAANNRPLPTPRLV